MSSAALSKVFELPAELRLPSLDWLQPQEVIAKADWYLARTSWELDLPDEMDLCSAEYEDFAWHHGPMCCVLLEFGGDTTPLPKRLGDWLIRRTLAQQALEGCRPQQRLSLGSKIVRRETVRCG